MPRVLRRPQAADDVLEVWDYIAEDSLDQADAWVDRLDAALRRLATQPLMGRARSELADDLRSLSFERYVIFYLPIPRRHRCCSRLALCARCGLRL